MDDLWAQFETDPQLEIKGVYVQYGRTRLKVARAGGANKKYALCKARVTRPYARSISAQTIDEAEMRKLLRVIYSQSIVTGWETDVSPEDGKEPEWVDGILRKGMAPVRENLTPVTPDSVLGMFEALPDLFDDVMELSMGMDLYLKTLEENIAGN